jgi:hypothetical protein
MATEVPYLLVHDLLSRSGWVLMKITKSGGESRRVYLSDVPGRPAVSFPVRNKMVESQYFEKIESIIENYSGDASDENEKFD